MWWTTIWMDSCLLYAKCTWVLCNQLEWPLWRKWTHLNMPMENRQICLGIQSFVRGHFVSFSDREVVVLLSLLVCLLVGLLACLCVCLLVCLLACLLVCLLACLFARLLALIRSWCLRSFTSFLEQSLLDHCALIITSLSYSSVNGLSCKLVVLMICLLFSKDNLGYQYPSILLCTQRSYCATAGIVKKFCKSILLAIIKSSFQR